MKPPKETARSTGPGTPSSSISPVLTDAAPNTPSKTRKGRFLPGTSGNPKGRPKGSFNRSTIAARAILEHNSTRLMDKAIELALNGQPLALRLCLERLVPVPQDRPVSVNLPKHPANPAEIYASHNAILAAAARAEITPQEARHLSALVEARRRSWESVELANRMTEVENRQAQSTRK